MKQTIQSINSTGRIQSLDLLRGFALLGILLMNITSFSQVGAAYMNPKISAGLEGYNRLFWDFNWLFSDTRFMSMFSMLFGAGVVLFSNRIESRNELASKWHFRRMGWLLLFGLFHAYFIWMGDILVAYALCGCLVFTMRNLKLRTLWIIGGLFFSVPVIFGWLTYFGTPAEQLAETFAFYDIDPNYAATLTDAFRGSYFDHLPYRIEGAIELQTLLFLIETFWRASSMMILGMILFRSGFLSGLKSNSFYGWVFMLGMIFGLIISGYGLLEAYVVNWSGPWVMNIGSNYNYLASALMAVAYFAGLIWVQKKDLFKTIRIQLQLVGRMAFTNYIGMSVICTLIFYGHGLGLFETFDRLQQFLTVIIVWCLIIIASSLILSKYKQGPLESLWRKLTYYRLK